MISVTVGTYIPSHTRRKGGGRVDFSLSILDEKKITAISRRALKRAVQSMRKIAVSEVVKNYYISGSEVRGTINVIQQVNGLLFQVRGSRTALEKFRFTPGRRGKNHIMLKAAVRKGNRVKGIPGAFAGNGKLHGIWQRVNDAPRYPIKKALGPSVPQMLENNPDIIGQMRDAAFDTFEKVMAHEVKRALGV